MSSGGKSSSGGGSQAPASSASASSPATSSSPQTGAGRTTPGFSNLALNTGTAGFRISSTTVPNLPLGALPQISPGNLTQNPASAANLFPKIPGQPNPAPQAAPGGHGTEAAAAADHGPLDKQLLGTQMLGLAALCAAVGIVVARLTLRGHRLGRRSGGSQGGKA